jgi:hypothetical protein
VGMGLNYFKVEIYIKVLIRKVNFMVLDNIIGKMEAIIKVNLKKVFGVDMESGRKIREKVTNTKDNFTIIKNKDTEFIHGHADISIREITRTT